MRTPRRLLPRSLVLLGVLGTVAVTVLGACARKPSPPAGTQYTVRGEIVALPAAAGEPLLLRHEPIDGFIDASGKVVGMDAMTMPFPLAPGVSLEGLAKGDKVEVVFSMSWSPRHYAIESLKKLPADTVLRAGKAQPPQ
jgi:Cu/Ag efflux protein CusF